MNGEYVKVDSIKRLTGSRRAEGSNPSFSDKLARIRK